MADPKSDLTEDAAELNLPKDDVSQNLSSSVKSPNNNSSPESRSHHSERRQLKRVSSHRRHRRERERRRLSSSRRHQSPSRSRTKKKKSRERRSRISRRDRDRTPQRSSSSNRKRSSSPSSSRRRSRASRRTRRRSRSSSRNRRRSRSSSRNRKHHSPLPRRTKKKKHRSRSPRRDRNRTPQRSSSSKKKRSNSPSSKKRRSRSPSRHRRHHGPSRSRTKRKRNRSRSRRKDRDRTSSSRSIEKHRSRSPHSISQSQQENTIPDNSLYAELLKNKHKRELEAKKILENLNNKAETETSETTVKPEAADQIDIMQATEFTTSFSEDIDAVPMPSDDIPTTVNLNETVLLESVTPPSSPLNEIPYISLTPLPKHRPPNPVSSSVETTPARETPKTATKLKITELPLPPGISESDLEFIDSPPICSSTPLPVVVVSAKPKMPLVKAGTEELSEEDDITGTPPRGVNDKLSEEPELSAPKPQLQRPNILQPGGSRTFQGVSGKEWGERCIDMFEVIAQVGEGTYGQVYKAKDKDANELVALKKVKLDNDRQGLPITAVREIKILRQLNHKNIVNLREVIDGKQEAVRFRKVKRVLYLVFEYMDHDLNGLLASKMVKFSELNNACIMKQLLEGLNYCHKMNVLHRDISCSNVLMNNRGEVKLADFGLARVYNSEDRQGRYTNKVITLWYRPPELLLGAEIYGPAVDIWSCGCILGELFVKTPMFRASAEVMQLHMISRVCGTPTPGVWPSVIHLPLFHTLNPRKLLGRKLRENYSFMPPPALDLLDKMLNLDPEKRISAEDALKSPWLENIHPEKIAAPELPSWQDCHELLSRKKKIKMLELDESIKKLPPGGPLGNVEDATAGKSEDS